MSAAIISIASVPSCCAPCCLVLSSPPLPDVDLHFWDSPDDLLGAHMDLLFERDRVYLHKAHGHYGAVPLSVSGVLGEGLGFECDRS